MLYANIENKRQKAEPGLHALCPLCQQEVISKCGDIKIWHWAHRSLDICDSFKESETEWHRSWKSFFPENQQEVIVKKSNDYHIADVKNHWQMVIEFQHSNISFDDIKKRENFYGIKGNPRLSMVWIFDCQDTTERMERTPSGIRWYAPKRNWKACNQPVFLDCGSEMFHVQSNDVTVSHDGDIPIWEINGEFLNKSNLIRYLKGDPPISIGVWCRYNKMTSFVNYNACLWHRKENDHKCINCEYWLYPVDARFSNFLNDRME